MLLFHSLLLLVIVAYDVVHLVRLLPIAVSRQYNAATTVADLAEDYRRLPKVSVIIPVYNGQKTITRTLESIFASVYPDFETLVIDDGSADGTVATVTAWSRNSGHPVKIVKQAHAGKAVGQNCGLHESGGEIIIYLDSDSYVIPNFIEKSLKVLADTGKGAIDYVQQVSNPDASPWTKVAEFERKLLELEPQNFGALFVLRRATAERFPFTPCLSPQYDIDARLNAADELVFDPTPVVFSDEPESLRRTFTRKVRWTHGFLEAISNTGLPRWQDKALFVFLMSLSFVGVELACLVLPYGIFFNRIFLLFPLTLFIVLAIKNAILATRLRLSKAVAGLFTFYQLYIMNLAVVVGTIRYWLNKPPRW